MKYMQGSTTETSPIPALKEVLRGFNFLNVSKVFGKLNLAIMTMLLKCKKETIPELPCSRCWWLTEAQAAPRKPGAASDFRRGEQKVWALFQKIGVWALFRGKLFRNEEALFALGAPDTPRSEWRRQREHLSCICDVRRHLINEILWIFPKSYIQKSEWRRRRVHFISTQTKHMSRIFFDWHTVIPSMESS